VSFGPFTRGLASCKWRWASTEIGVAKATSQAVEGGEYFWKFKH
jgi:hypothetical protein